MKATCSAAEMRSEDTTHAPLWPGWATATAETSSDRKSTRLNSSHLVISYAVFCLKKKKVARSIPRLEYVEPEDPIQPDPVPNLEGGYRITERSLVALVGGRCHDRSRLRVMRPIRR